MEGRLMIEAAREGKFEVLEKMLNGSPTALADIKIVSMEESLLHVATKSGHISFVRGLLEVDADGAREVDKDGFRPLDIAVVMGNLGMVKELLSFDKDLVRVKGKDRRTALHYAAMKGRVDIVDELMMSSPESVEDVTVQEETALHLAVKCFHFDVFATLLKWIEKLGKETMVNMRDVDENTVIHYAVLTKQYMCLELLLGETSTIKETVNVDAENAKGLTALDIIELMTQDSYDVKVMKLLQRAVVVKPDKSTSKQKTSSKRIKQALQPVLSRNWFEYFKFQEERDSPSDTRNVLLVVAALIATVTFQAGVTPPSGIFDPVSAQTSFPNNSQPRTRIGPVGGSAVAAASAIFGSHASSHLFLFTNSLGLTASVCIIIYLTARFPFQRELLLSLYSMMFTYGIAVNTIIKGTDSGTKAVVYALMTVAFIFPFLQRWIPRWGKKTWRIWRRRAIRQQSQHIALPSDITDI